jgi:hypothetical protein
MADVMLLLYEVLESLPAESENANKLGRAIEELRKHYPFDTKNQPDVSQPLATLKEIHAELPNNAPESYSLAMAIIAYEETIRLTAKGESP